jgi:hypothetical protein
LAEKVLCLGLELFAPSRGNIPDEDHIDVCGRRPRLSEIASCPRSMQVRTLDSRLTIQQRRQALDRPVCLEQERAKLG